MTETFHAQRNHPRQRPKRKGKTRIRIDMTAMVDVAFLLLTFFVLTAMIFDQYQIEMVMPPKCDHCPEQTLPVNEEKVMTVILEEGRKVYYYKGITDARIVKTNFSSGGLRQVLLDHNQVIDPMLVIKPKAKSEFQSLVDVIDEVEITGLKKYAIGPLASEDSVLLNQYQEIQHL